MATTVPGNKAVMLTNEERLSITHFIDTIGGNAASLVGPQGDEMPDELKKLLKTILDAVQSGQSISISTLPQEITTTTAASMLNVSRPTVMKYIRNGRLNSRKVGSHHRLNSQEVLDLLEAKKHEQRKAVFELIDLEESLN
ncbi:helix-turn-helix domain-containing protein [Corynebacterium sp.]|uniref:helix-turn-helix domain-containing protein n=1 Tax=Corynebacterium sp. TaxID=1720 RepID=UPI0026DB4B8D|nr:helix-turn-helix domain-containing protein [Corynebacterium sp.]MDO5076446.1 helix-turn-helix domain-containing protein [Corynebacterium sp.]